MADAMGRPGSHAAHAARGSSADQRRRNVLIGVVTSVVVLVLVVGVILVTSSQHGGTGHGSGPQQVSSTHHLPPLHVVATSPAAKATNVAPDATLSVTMSAPISSTSPTPSLSPAVGGSWTLVSPTQWQFTAAGPLVPQETETLAVPGGSSGVVGQAGQRLSSTYQTSFTVAQGSTLRLQELLAELGYLPLSFTPTAPVASPQDEADAQPGSFAWRWSSLEADLASSWSEGTTNTITHGAIMSFENDNNLGVDGDAGPQVWATLLSDVSTGQADPQPYNYVYVTTSLPESVTVYSDGNAVYNSLANTGVPGAATQAGTFPVFARFTSTTMTGTNVDGSHYVDPGIPWVSYFNGGDALHGYVRAGYGYPQSNGCVEMPVANAAVVFPLTPLGTLVTVE